jgi:hypothetical protein
MFKFKVSYVALAAALSSSVVYADPTSYTHILQIVILLALYRRRPHNLIAYSTSALSEPPNNCFTRYTPFPLSRRIII